MSHTPGPWNLHPYYAENEPLTVEDEEFEFLYLPFGPGEKIVGTTEYHSISKGWPGVNSVEECRANANLIAAAPDLLEALEELVVWRIAMRLDATKAITAIEKAKGEA